jgi:hypothetical protein
MTSRELVIKTLNREPVPRVARDLWLSNAEGSPREEELAELAVRYPSDIVTPEAPMLRGRRPPARPAKPSEWTDAWGCVWRAGAEGRPPEIKHAPLAEVAKIASYQPPAEVLEHSRFAKASKLCSATSRFVLAWSEVRAFDRLRMLRGDEAALVDLARGSKETRQLLALLHDVACKELEHWAASEVDGVALRDDWGTAEGLLVSPEMWRDIFRPLYRDYCRILHAQDKFVFFHSEGDISDILGELIKLGVDAVHCQLHLMNVERVAKRYRGRVTFWGGMDGQRLRNPPTAEEFREAVLELRRALDCGSGGVIAQCQWEPGVQLHTLTAFFEQWLVPLPVKAGGKGAGD